MLEVLSKFRVIQLTVCLAIIISVTGVMLQVPGSSVESRSPQPTPVNYTSLVEYDLIPEGEHATLVLHAPEVGEVGELLRFDVSESNAESFQWLVVPESVDFEVYNDGRRAVFSARRAGDYMFIVACAYKGTVDIATHIVTITGNNPLPPQPDEPDDLVVPEPEKGAAIDAWVTYWCASHALSANEALQLAASFESIASMIVANVDMAPQEIVTATGKANRDALGDSIDAWLPFLQLLQADLRQRAEREELVTAQQHAETWKKIAQGLREYAHLMR